MWKIEEFMAGPDHVSLSHVYNNLGTIYNIVYNF